MSTIRFSIGPTAPSPFAPLSTMLAGHVALFDVHVFFKREVLDRTVSPDKQSVVEVASFNAPFDSVVKLTEDGPPRLSSPIRSTRCRPGALQDD